MHKTTRTQGLLLGAIWLVAACTGPTGPQGQPCSVKDNGNGTSTITCPDGTTANVANGTAGKDGTNGTAGKDGTNGVNGDAGSSCTAVQVDGGIQVSCTNGTGAFIPNGSTGSTGTPGPAGLGLSTGFAVQVVDVKTDNGIKVHFRVADDRGNPVDLAGKYSINTVNVPKFSLSLITVDGGMVLPYTVYSKTGSATAATVDAGAPDPATVVVTPTAFTPTYPIPVGGVPASDAVLKGLLVENGTGAGDYTYTFPTGGNTQVKNSAGKFVTTVTAPITIDSAVANNTHTIWIQAARQTDIVNTDNAQTFDAIDTEYNFIPSGVGTPIRREIAATASCSKCHNKFTPEDKVSSAFHGGGRVEANYCNVCHNPGRTTNLAANSSVFVHRIHASKRLVANPDGGTVSADAFHGIEIGFPQDVRNCDACHAGALQGAQASTNPNIAACTSCHDNVTMDTTSPLPKCTTPPTLDSNKRFVPCRHQANAPTKVDGQCAGCHDAVTLATEHLAVLPPDPAASQILTGGGYGLPDGGVANNNTNAAYIGATGDVPTGAKVTTYVIKEVKADATFHPTITFKLQQGLKGATPADVDFGTYAAGTNVELIPGFVGGPSAYFAFAVPQDGIAAPADFNASASCYLRSAWNGSATSGASACSLSAKDSNGYYTVTMTNIVLPSTATMLTGGVGYTYAISSARPLTQVNLSTYPYDAATGIGGLIVAAPDVWKVGTGYTGRRAVVETARCNNCHVQLGVGPTFHAGQRNDAPTCSFCHNPNRTSSGWSANVKDFVHSIHAGRVRTVDFNWHAISPAENYGEVEFPSNLNNCQACHAPGTNDFTIASTNAALPNMLPSTVGQGRYDVRPAYNSSYFSVSPYVVGKTSGYSPVDYGYGFATSNVGYTLPDAYSGTQGVNNCTPVTPCICTAGNPCSFSITTDTVTVQGVAANFTQKIGAATNACNSTTNCTCTTAQPCTAVLKTCSLGAPCDAQPTTLVKSPIVAACSACHDAPDAVAHMKANGGTFYQDRATYSANTEQCLVCHGPGTIAPITLMHKN